MKTHCKLLVACVLAFVSASCAFSQVIQASGCSVDLELPLLPKCALVTNGDQIYIAPPFVRPLFIGVTSRLSSALLPDIGWSYFDRSGLVRVKGVAPFDNGASYFHFGLVRVERAGKYGLSTDRGTLVTPLYDGMSEFEPDHHVWKACRSCRLVKHGEYSMFEGGSWFWLDRRGHAVDQAEAH